MEHLIKDKDDIIKSSLMDKLYQTNNLVAGYMVDPNEIKDSQGTL